MKMSPPARDPLVKQLTRASGRRFARYEWSKGGYKEPLSGIDELEALAREYTERQPGLNRGERIEKLIWDATERVKNETNKKRLVYLFGLRSDLRAYDTTKELHTVMKVDLDDLGDAKTIYDRNQAAFVSLASAIRRLVPKRHLLMSEPDPALLNFFDGALYGDLEKQLSTALGLDPEAES